MNSLWKIAALLAMALMGASADAQAPRKIVIQAAAQVPAMAMIFSAVAQEAGFLAQEGPTRR
ncbi:MAG: hypothetical protein QM586_02915 [Xenophilus sp.]